MDNRSRLTHTEKNVNECILRDLPKISSICRQHVRVKSAILDELAFQITAIGHQLRISCLLDFFLPQTSKLAQILEDIKISFPSYPQMICLTFGEDEFVYIVRKDFPLYDLNILNRISLLNVSKSLHSPKKADSEDMNDIHDCLIWLQQSLEESVANSTVIHLSLPKVPTWAVFLNGWILQYPGIYYLSAGETANNLSMVPLKLWKCCVEIEGKRKELWSFSWPETHVSMLNQWEAQLTIPYGVYMDRLSVTLPHVAM